MTGAVIAEAPPVRKNPLLTQDEIAFVAYLKHLRRLVAP